MSRRRPLAESTMSVVLASIDARRTVEPRLARWLAELDGRGTLVVVDASRDGTADLIAERFPGVRLLRRPPGRLAPELWRDGLDATETPLVAFSTTQMTPTEGWLAAMLARLDETGAVAVGGPIDPPDASDPLCRATYLHRYIPYLRPIVDRGRVEPPGDNAVYRRDGLDGLEALWEGGFWEVEIHRALRARGGRLAMADDAVVTYQGGVGGISLLRQRFDHARHYGAGRARGMGTLGRLGRIVAAPIIPALLLGRTFAALASRGKSPLPWLPALPPLLALLAAWSLGEAVGMGAGRPPRDRIESSLECARNAPSAHT